MKSNLAFRAALAFWNFLFLSFSRRFTFLASSTTFNLTLTSFCLSVIFKFNSVISKVYASIFLFVFSNSSCVSFKFSLNYTNSSRRVSCFSLSALNLLEKSSLTSLWASSLAIKSLISGFLSL